MSLNRSRYGMAPWPLSACCLSCAFRPGRRASAVRLALLSAKGYAMTTLRALFLSALLLISTVALGNSRTAVVEQYVNALGTRNYKAAAQLVGSRDLAEFKQAFVVLFRSEAQAGQSDFLKIVFGAKATLDDALNSPPDAFFAAIVQFVFSQASKVDVRVKTLPAKVLGEIPEGSEMVHVLARTSIVIGDVNTSKVEVFSLTQEGAQWKIVLPDQLRGLGKAFQARMLKR